MFPNQFVNVRLLLDLKTEAILVPAPAIQRGPQGTFVYVVKPDQTVEVRPVTLGRRPRPTASIATGLAPGEQVVIDGVDKLRAGQHGAGAQRGGRRERAAHTRRMNPSRPFILRPVATVAADGRASCWPASSPTGSCRSRRCRRSIIPTIQVLTFYPGASPDVMASSVTAPLERQFGQVPGLNQMTSTSSERQLGHHAAVRPRPRTSTSPSRRCRRRSTRAGTFLPRDLPNPPIYSKTNPADAPILTLALTSNTLPLSKVRIWPTRGWRRRSRSCPASAW